MATLEELFELRNSSVLRNRVVAAGWRLAKTIFLEPEATPLHAARLLWADKCLREPGEGSKISQLFRAVIVVLEDTGAASTDAQIETAVAQVVDKFVTVGV